MKNKQWLLNHAALIKAKSCISIIERELGIRLKLTHPQFLEMIAEYSEMSDCPKLQDAFRELLDVTNMSDKVKMPIKKVVNMAQFTEESSKQHLEIVGTSSKTSTPIENITYKGKNYRRFNSQGKEFSGLYRGQPCYR